MKYRTFTDKCVNGAEVTDGNRNGIIIKKSQNNEKALVRFSDGITEWVEYYKIELYDKKTD